MTASEATEVVAALGRIGELLERLAAALERIEALGERQGRAAQLDRQDPMVVIESTLKKGCCSSFAGCPASAVVASSG
jgi:Na+-translocating ferredoxin:NAD+ oxidoreductase RNF subunit RnfB